MPYSRSLIWFLLACLFCPIIALAGVHPIPMILRFNGQSSQDFTVINEDRNKVAYVTMQVEAYQAPDKSNPKKPPAKAQILDPRQSGVLVSPSKLALPPGGSRLVRVRLIQPPGESERRYVVRVTPVEGELITGTGASKDIRAGVRVVVAYGVVVIVPPLGSKS